MKHSKKLLAEFLNSHVIKNLSKNEKAKVKGGTENVIDPETDNEGIIDDIDNL